MIDKKYRNKLLVISAIAAVLGVALLFIPHKKADAPVNKNFSENNIEPKKDQPKCGIESCHGLDNITCGKNVPETCTEEYQLGDSCRRFFQCRIQNGECEKIENSKFDECKDCISKCREKFKEDDPKIWECEEACHLKINGTDKPELE